MRALPVALTVLLLVSPMLAGAMAGGSAGHPATVASDAATPLDAPSTAVESTSGTDESPPPANASADVPNGTSPQVTVPDPNESRVLAIAPADIDRTGFARYSIDLGPAVGFSANQTAMHLETAAMIERVESAPSMDERQRRILGELSKVEQRVITLKSKERNTIDAFSQGRISARELLIRLARIDAESSELNRRVTALRSLSEETQDFSLDGARVASLRFELQTFDGPVRSRVSEVLQGKVAPETVFVETGPESVVLSTIVNDTYVREAYRGDIRVRAGESITPQEAEAVANQSYPVIWQSGGTRAQVIGSGPTYIVQIPHSEGEVVAYVDSGAKEVFKEFQTRPLATMGDGEAASNTIDNLHLSVNRTYPGGPLRITIRESDTGNPVNATVKVSQGQDEGQVVGATGFDGEVWTLSPRGQFTVTAIQGRTSAVFVNVNPTETPAINTTAQNDTT